MKIEIFETVQQTIKLATVILLTVNKIHLQNFGRKFVKTVLLSKEHLHFSLFDLQRLSCKLLNYWTTGLLAVTLPKHMRCCHISYCSQPHTHMHKQWQLYVHMIFN